MIQNPYLLHFHSTISFIPVESISWELALKPGYYTIIVPYASILFVRVITVFRAHTTLTRGFFRTPQVSPGESTHIPRTSVSPEVYTPVGHRFSGTSPRAGLASGKFPTRQRCLPCDPTGCLCNELGVCEGLGGQYHTMTNKTQSVKI